MTKSRSLLRWGLVGGVVGAISLAASVSQAQVNVYSDDSLNIDIGATAAVAWITTRNAFFGAGGDYGARPEETDTTWQESYIEPWAGLTYNGVGAGQVYLNASFIAAATRGDGDVSGFLVEGSENISGESYAVGWTGDMGGTGVDISYGQQEFHVGTDFILGLGHFASGQEGAYWTGPAYAFERAGIMRLEGAALDGVRADIFHLETDATQGDSDFAGVNVEYHDEEIGGDLGVMYLHGTDSLGYANREGMEVLDIRAHGNPMASMMPNWHFAVEYVNQWNDDSAVEVASNAYYFDIGYTFVDWPWAPDVTYRFAHFSGDDPNTMEDETYDPLFYGFTNWGTWFIGEVAGEYMIFNSNFDVHMLMVQASPYDNLFVTVSGFDFTINEPSPGMDDKFGQELNFIADLSLGDNMAISANYAVHFPDGNAEATFGGDDNFHVMHAGAWVWF